MGDKLIIRLVPKQEVIILAERSKICRLFQLLKLESQQKQRELEERMSSLLKSMVSHSAELNGKTTPSLKLNDKALNFGQ